MEEPTANDLSLSGERPHYCSLCNKGFQTSSDLKRHKKTRVHQERVEQAGGDPDASADGDVSMEGVKEDDDDEDDVDTEQGGQEWDGGNRVTAVKSAAGADQTAQALLNSITQPLTGPPSQPQSSSASSSTFTSSSSTTVDMKAIGGAAAWNNNQQAQLSTPVAASSSSTIDLKDIGGSTVDLGALKWQQQPQQQQQPATPASAANNVASGMPTLACSQPLALDP